MSLNAVVLSVQRLREVKNAIISEIDLKFMHVPAVIVHYSSVCIILNKHNVCHKHAFAGKQWLTSGLFTSFLTFQQISLLVDMNHIKG